MREDAAKEDHLKTVGMSLLRIPKGLVLEAAEELVRKVQEALGARMDQMPSR
jgi:very-short-patch-repair endonuclease